MKTFQYFSNKERYSAVQTYSSGSPVFLYEIFGQYLEFLKQRKIGGRMKFLPSWWEIGENNEKERVGDERVPSNTDILIVRWASY